MNVYFPTIMRESEAVNARKLGMIKIVNEDFFVGIISTKCTSEFYQILSHYKDLRDGKKLAELPKVGIKSSLATQFAKFKSKYKTKDRSIKMIVNMEKTKARNKKNSQEEKTNMINDLNNRNFFKICPNNY